MCVYGVCEIQCQCYRGSRLLKLHAAIGRANASVGMSEIIEPARRSPPQINIKVVFGFVCKRPAGSATTATHVTYNTCPNESKLGLVKTRFFPAFCPGLFENGGGPLCFPANGNLWRVSNQKAAGIRCNRCTSFAAEMHRVFRFTKYTFPNRG